MTDWLSRLDQDLTLWLNSFHNPVSDSVMIFLSDKGVWIPFYILVLAFIFRRLGTKKALITLGAVALTVLACDQTADLVKYSVQRLRPCYNTLMLDGGLHILEKRGGFYGFFSGHAANAFGVAICTIAALRADKGRYDYMPFNIMMILWALGISLSRVFVGKHFLGDVIVGAAAGCIIGGLLGTLAAKLLRRLQ